MTGGTHPADTRFPLFDSLRAIAALSVFVVHLPFVFLLPATNPFRPYLTQLTSGIAVFFLISGFLLYRPFARARFAGAPRPRTGAYAVRRTLRIGPAYWIALPLVVLLLGASAEGVGTTPVFSGRGIPSYFGFAQVYDRHTVLGGISAAWTLCVEAAFYVLLPVWGIWMRKLGKRRNQTFVRTELTGLALLFAVGLGFTVFAAVQSRPDPAVFFDVTRIKVWLYVLPGYLDHFAVGMGLAVVSVAVAGRSRPPRAVRVLDRASWLPWLVAVLTFFAISHLAAWLPGQRATQVVLTHFLQAVMALGLLLPAVFGDPARGLVRRILANRVLLWIGLVSYSLYLWHVAIFTKLAHWGALDSFSRGAFALLALVVTLLVAAASFYAVERPSLRLARRVGPGPRHPDADVRMRDLARHEHVEAP